MQVQVSPRTVRWLLTGAIGSLLLVHVSVVLGRLVFDLGKLSDLRMLFDFDEEKNFPALYSSFVLMACALVLWWIGQRHRIAGESCRYWWGLCAVFVFLSADEVIGFHEHIDQVKGTVLERQRVSGWILPYLAALALLGVGYLKFLLRLPARHRNWFVGAGALFVLGTVGCELLGPAMQRRGRGFYAACYTLEELFEMIGAAVFLLGLLDYSVATFGALSLRIAPTRADSRE